jgi:hypothetical protein
MFTFPLQLPCRTWMDGYRAIQSARESARSAHIYASYAVVLARCLRPNPDLAVRFLSRAAQPTRPGDESLFINPFSGPICGSPFLRLDSGSTFKYRPLNMIACSIAPSLFPPLAMSSSSDNGRGRRSHDRPILPPIRDLFRGQQPPVLLPHRT